MVRLPESEYNKEITNFKAMLLELADYTDGEIEKGDFLDMDNSEIIRKIGEKKSRQLMK
ncbi:MAG: hypothetical protein ACYCSG_03955 [Thermoplasmataceae archaeon]